MWSTMKGYVKQWMAEAEMELNSVNPSGSNIVSMIVTHYMTKPRETLIFFFILFQSATCIYLHY